MKSLKPINFFSNLFFRSIFLQNSICSASECEEAEKSWVLLGIQDELDEAFGYSVDGKSGELGKTENNSPTPPATGIEPGCFPQLTSRKERTDYSKTEGGGSSKEEQFYPQPPPREDLSKLSQALSSRRSFRLRGLQLNDGFDKKPGFIQWMITKWKEMTRTFQKCVVLRSKCVFFERE